MYSKQIIENNITIYRINHNKHYKPLGGKYNGRATKSVPNFHFPFNSYPSHNSHTPHPDTCPCTNTITTLESSEIAKHFKYDNILYISRLIRPDKKRVQKEKWLAYVGATWEQKLQDYIKAQQDNALDAAFPLARTTWSLPKQSSVSNGNSWSLSS